MPIRPHSISELEQFSKDDSLPSSRGIKDWLRVADALRKQGQQAIRDGDHQGAFLFLARSALYIIEKICHHPSYHKLNPTQMDNLKNNGRDIQYCLEQLKPRLVDRYKQWLAKDPRHAEIPSQLQGAYGAAISPVVVPQSKGGRGVGASLETRRPQSRLQEAESGQSQEREIARRQEEDAARVAAQEQATRRQWDIQAAGYTPQSSRYRERGIASSPSLPSSARLTSEFDAPPPYTLQDPSIIRTELQDQSTSPIRQENTPTETRSQLPLYQQHPNPLDMSFSFNVHIQYPHLMSAHQRAQGHQPSVMLPSPQISISGASRGNGGGGIEYSGGGGSSRGSG